MVYSRGFPTEVTRMDAASFQASSPLRAVS